MSRQHWTLAVLVSVVTWACGEPVAGPDAALKPNFAAGGVGRPSVLVNPNSDANGTAKTIQEGIDMVAEGGKVLIVPATYVEALVIGKGLTLEGVREMRDDADAPGGAVVLEPPPTAVAGILVTSTDPVIITGTNSAPPRRRRRGGYRRRGPHARACNHPCRAGP